MESYSDTSLEIRDKPYDYTNIILLYYYIIERIYFTRYRLLTKRTYLILWKKSKIYHHPIENHTLEYS